MVWMLAELNLIPGLSHMSRKKRRRGWYIRAHIMHAEKPPE